MRIAFITYEYPPDIAKGGIATYVEQASALLNQIGNQVEIFCGSHARDITENNDGVLIHRCLTTDLVSFREDCLNKFTERHAHLAFDLVESPEIFSNALLFKNAFPRLPLVVKLHMASFIQARLLNFYTSRFTKLRYFLGSLLRGKIKFYGAYDYATDTEYQFTVTADAIVAPSEAQKKIIQEEWHLPEENICVIPNPFVPPADLLAISVTAPVEKIVTFIGKLNVHKGIVNLVKIIPLVVKNHPDVVFRLIGNDSYFAAKKMMMSVYIQKELQGYENNYQLLGGLEYDAVLQQFKTTAVCIFPSLWECFGLVCLEAMSAGRAVIGSSAGGMMDILSNGSGILVDPENVPKMAKAVNNLLEDEDLRWHYATAGRARVLSHYNTEKIGAQMEIHYRNVIAASERNT